MATDSYNKVYYDENKEQVKAKRRERYRSKKSDVVPIEPECRDEKSKLKVVVEAETIAFWSGVKKAFSSIDGERTAKSVPLLFAASIVIMLFWMQSKELYESAGFSDPGFVAIGGLLMIAGFSSFHAVSKSKVALALCLYVGCFEAYFVVAGTLNDEAVVEEKSDPELKFLEEKAEKSRGEYQSVKGRYEDPSSKLFHNGWFKKKFVTPAWEKHEKAQREFLGRRTEIEAGNGIDHVALLKILYRLGMVLLVMLMVHRVVANKQEFA